jgi:acetyl-CoA carboxylase carboxyltransferase component
VSDHERLRKAAERALAGGPEKYREKVTEQGKLFVRDRVALLCEPGSFVEDGLLANAASDETLAADAVVTGRGVVDGRPAVIIANDPTVKAGSWGARTVEKIVRALEAAYDERLPVFYLVDSAGARITDQVELFPGGAGPVGSSGTRYASPGGCRRSAACSARRPPAAPTSRRSATSSSWSRGGPRCISDRRAWPRWWSAR